MRNDAVLLLPVEMGSCDREMLDLKCQAVLGVSFGRPGLEGNVRLHGTVITWSRRLISLLCFPRQTPSLRRPPRVQVGVLTSSTGCRWVHPWRRREDAKFFPQSLSSSMGNLCPNGCMSSADRRLLGLVAPLAPVSQAGCTSVPQPHRPRWLLGDTVQEVRSPYFLPGVHQLLPFGSCLKRKMLFTSADD